MAVSMRNDSNGDQEFKVAEFRAEDESADIENDFSFLDEESNKEEEVSWDFLDEIDE